MTDEVITWTPTKLVRFKEAYKKAHEESRDTVNDVFTFEDNVFVLSYAKYLIEYLDTVMPK